jgi:hypothetical protein
MVQESGQTHNCDLTLYAERLIKPSRSEPFKNISEKPTKHQLFIQFINYVQY